MKKNVGVSGGCPWKRRRVINDYALNTDKLHPYYQIYNDNMHNLLKNVDNKLDFNDLLNIGRKNVYKIVFNSEDVHDDVFEIFRQANNTDVFYNDNFSVESSVFKNYKNTIERFINYPERNSLIELCLKVSKNKDDIYHQIPHFIFPIFGLFLTTTPRLLILLSSHQKIFEKVIAEVKQNEITYLPYLRKCVMETVRLNAPVISLFRTLEKDLQLNKRYFKKGTQLLLLTNPVLRQPEHFNDAYKFVPERWNEELEKEYYAISFSQGPQKCPGKELAIFLVQSFIYNLIKVKEIGTKNRLISNKTVNADNIPQVINTCDVVFDFKKI